MNNQSEFVRRATVGLENIKTAVDALVEQLTLPNMEVVIFFCSPTAGFKELSKALDERFDCPVIGCTGAGELCGGYHQGSLVAMSLSSIAFRVHSALIESLDQWGVADADKLLPTMCDKLEFSTREELGSRFGMLLIDGLSLQEERLVSALYTAANGMPIVGGSAGDSLEFEETLVYYQGKFRRDCAVFSVVETTLDFEIFKLEHFHPSDLDMVITGADPENRTVTEINGVPAAEEYAALLGCDIGELTPQSFSSYPVMLEVGGNWYVRSIAKVNDDGSLTFYCAIDNGLPLTIAHRNDLVDSLRAQVQRLQKRFERIDLTLGFDCVLRGLELDQHGGKSDAGALFEELKTVGVSTFGEQFNGMHVNQTLVGVTFGELRA